MLFDLNFGPNSNGTTIQYEIGYVKQKQITAQDH